MNYDESKDQSEECGWLKVCDEPVPTEQEQLLWGRITVGFVMILGLITIFL